MLWLFSIGDVDGVCGSRGNNIVTFIHFQRSDVVICHSEEPPKRWNIESEETTKPHAIFSYLIERPVRPGVPKYLLLIDLEWKFTDLLIYAKLLAYVNSLTAHSVVNGNSFVITLAAGSI